MENQSEELVQMSKELAQKDIIIGRILSLNSELTLKLVKLEAQVLQAQMEAKAMMQPSEPEGE